jgi:quinone-modifying oxidoreductase subunit QmoC
MAIRVNPKLIDELEVYGAQDVQKCYHCGNCSAVCPFSEAPYIFPRRPMRFLQMGLEEKLKGSLEPWLCYYCGECTEDCPRGAEPGETMMSLRRWLTSKYDFTGISRLFYRSGKIELGAVLGAAILTGLGFVLWAVSRGGSIHSYDGASAFMPAASIHVFDWVLAGVLLVLLLTNCARMWWFTMGRDKTLHIPPWLYIKKLYSLPLHFFTQKRYATCVKKRPWAIHLALMLSYVTMLILIMFFLRDMASGPGIVWPAHAFGILATAGLLGTTIFAIRGRLKKSEPLYAHSHETDWIFLGLLVFVAFTGILQFVLHRAGLGMAANVTYVVHLMGVVPMLGLEVPFSKWSHLAYRPLGMYFSLVRAEAMAPAPAGEPEPVMVTQRVVG